MDAQAVMSKRLVALGPRDTLAKAAQVMQKEEVGCVLVVDAHRKALGILTDRDLVLRSVAVGRRPEEMKLEEAMSRDLVVARCSEPVLLVARRMADHQVRRLPVLDEKDQVVGLISVDDLLTIFITELSNVATAIVGTSRLIKR